MLPAWPPVNTVVGSQSGITWCCFVTVSVLWQIENEDKCWHKRQNENKSEIPTGGCWYAICCCLCTIYTIWKIIPHDSDREGWHQFCCNLLSKTLISSCTIYGKTTFYHIYTICESRFSCQRDNPLKYYFFILNVLFCIKWNVFLIIQQVGVLY